MKLVLTSLALASSLGAFAQSDSLTYDLRDVVVTGARGIETARELPMTISVLTRDALTAQQRTNVLPTLSEHVPSLFVTQRGMMGFGVSNGAAGGITMRGISSGSGQLLVLIDGHPQYNGIYGHSIGDAYGTMMAERVEVLRGPASVLYGSNAMGGVINIVTRDGQLTDGRHTHINLGGGSYGTAQAEVENIYNYGRFTSTVGAQYNRTDNHRPRMGFDQYGGRAKLGYAINDHWKAFATADITHFDASYPGTVDAPMYEADQWITRGVATLGVDNGYSGFSSNFYTKGRISAYCNWGRHKINDGYAEGAKPQARFFQSKDALTGISAYQNLFFASNTKITVGFDYQHIYGDAWYTNRETGEVMPTQNKQSATANMDELAGYVNLHQPFLSWLILDAGVRYDYHTVTGGEWIPQAGLVVRPTTSGELKLMASKGFRNPTMREMYLYPPSNEDLLPERLWNYEMGWKHRVKNGRFTYGVNLFWIEGDNMIQTATVKTPDGGSKKQNINVGEISNRGVELEGDWRVNSHWTLTTNHSYLYMKHHVLAAPQYKGYLGATMHYGKWSATAGLQQVCGLYTNVGTDDDPTETFTLLNATVAYQVLPWLQLWAKGDNLLAQKYEINAGYPMPSANFMGGVSINF